MNPISISNDDSTDFQTWTADSEEALKNISIAPEDYTPHIDELFQLESKYGLGELLPSSPVTENFAVPELDVQGVMDLFTGKTQNVLPPQVLSNKRVAPIQTNLAETENFLSPKRAAFIVQQQPSPKKKSNLKSPRISPEMSLVRLQYIFQSYCDPVSRLLNSEQFMQLMMSHRMKEKAPFNLTLNDPTVPDHLFGSSGKGEITMDTFTREYQICNRCTENKRKNSKSTEEALDFGRGTALVEEVAPVIVRVMPCHYEGKRVKSCEHFQWTWCPGFEVTGNPKCNGTNRHDKCPKYLANCTIWKHKLPPKSKKASSTTINTYQNMLSWETPKISDFMPAEPLLKRTKIFS